MKRLHIISRALLLMALAVGALGLPRTALAQLPTTDNYYVMDREAYSRTADTRLVRTTYDLEDGPNLLDFPLQLGDWVGQDLPITNEETFPTLDADYIVYRGYRRDADGGMVIFSLVGGSKGQSFHHPLVCYEWAHWATEDLGTTTVPAPGTDVVVREVVGVDPDGPRQIDFSFYLWPDDNRDWGEGATQVRVTGIAYDGDEKATGWARDFTSLLFADAKVPDTLGPLGPTGTEVAPPPLAPEDTGAAPPEAPEVAPAPDDQPLVPLPGEPPAAPSEEAPAAPSDQPADNSGD
ncbi:MAG TPA: exosortase-associated EpsI family protein [Chloroflexota bacterium]|nr:exosortase-associated EpsI family protein [Chloroflexota bacterium]